MQPIHGKIGLATAGVLLLAACGGGAGGDLADQAPQAAFIASQTTGFAPLTVSFDAARSSDADGWVSAFAWDFGDGAVATGISATHTFTAAPAGVGILGPGSDISSDAADSTSGALADVNGDGVPDLVVGNIGKNRLYLGDGAGGFAAGSDIGTEEDFTTAVALGDVDGDGDLDLVVGNAGDATHAGTANRLYLNDGNGGFTLSAGGIPDDAQDTRALALGDVDGDGDLDLVVGNTLTARNRLYLNDGTGSFAAGADITTDAYNTISIALGDVDGDGDLDIVTGNAGIWHTDVDGDGNLDPQSENRLYLNDGSGVFTGSDIAPADQGDTAAVLLADVDADGDLDLIAGNIGARDRLYLNDGSGGFSDGTDIATDIGATGSLAMADIDQDGDPDLVAGFGLRQANRLYLNDGTGLFDAGTDVSRDAYNTTVALLGDVDADGDPDVITLNDGIGASGSGAVNRLYRNGSGYTVRLTVTDDAGKTASSSQFIAVAQP